MINFNKQTVERALDALNIYYIRARNQQFMNFVFGRFKRNPNTLRLKTAGIVWHDRILNGRANNESEQQLRKGKSPGS